VRRRLAAALIVVAACGRVAFDPVGDALPDAPDAPPPYTSGSRLRAVLMTGEHGAAILWGWRDTVLDSDCGFALAADGVLRCVPDTTATSISRDSACTEPLGMVLAAHAAPGCDRPDRFTKRSGPETIYRVGPAWSGPLYSGTPGNCQPFSTTLVGMDLVELGAALDPDSMVAVTEENIPHGRLAYRIHRAADGAMQVVGTLDTALGERCEFHELEPGRAWCVPEGTSIRPTAFADAACTQELAFGAVGSTRAIVQDASLCDNGSRLVELGAPHAGTAYAWSNGACTADANPAFEIVRELPLDSLAAATRVIAPGDGRLRLASWRTADGYDAAGGLWDAARDDFCTPLVDAGTDRLVCAPLGLGARRLFTDDTCDASSFTMVVPSCRHRSTAVWTLPTDMRPFGCASARRSILASDVLVAPGPLFEWRRGSCAAADTIGVTLRALETSFLDGETLDAVRRVVD
jgi:hypothetical protein